jgi:hypothetical protein
VPIYAFNQCYGLSVEISGGEESELIGLRELDINSYDNYTVTLIP